MLIRSQNKLELVPLNKHIVIRIDEDLSLFQIGYWNMWQGEDYFNILGNYPTKEKALRVLDEIENTYVRFQQRYGSSTSNMDCIYVMPQEEEI